MSTPIEAKTTDTNVVAHSSSEAGETSLATDAAGSENKVNTNQGRDSNKDNTDGSNNYGNREHRTNDRRNSGAGGRSNRNSGQFRQDFGNQNQGRSRAINTAPSGAIPGYPQMVQPQQAGASIGAYYDPNTNSYIYGNYNNSPQIANYYQQMQK